MRRLSRATSTARGATFLALAPTTCRSGIEVHGANAAMTHAYCADFTALLCLWVEQPSERIHLLQLSCNALLADFELQGHTDILILHRPFRLGVNLVPQSAREPDQSKHAQRVISECLVLQPRVVEIVEKRVDRRIPPQCVLGGRAKLHLRIPAFLRTEDLRRDRFQVLGLLRVGLDFVEAHNRIVHLSLWEALFVLFQVLRLVQVLLQRHAELVTRHAADPDVDVTAVHSEQLVSDPAACEAQHRFWMILHIAPSLDNLLVPDVLCDVKKEGAQGALEWSELDGGDGVIHCGGAIRRGGRGNASSLGDSL
ncbi:hypothetical protein N7510_007804 [Penicillium lagena]|uniref:uncharacterized protein n=1 Tax=Penicillium lagena TaxID=94218 RepID=UPI0025414B13|nr:uncharacterized protein N7510_007804 [Penicillium lagena]KAJ5611085.1 hypothetical protein N7510_007804 [Penicillium lagena]